MVFLRAFVFPGQGSQFLGMGRDIYAASNTVRKIFNHANDLLQYDLTRIMFKGSENELCQTAQSAIFVYSYCLYQLLKNTRPAIAAGHSSGEYTALTIANALTFDDTLQLLKIRAEAMQYAATINEGVMAAIIGLDDDAIERICYKVRAEIGTVQIANFNCPGQVVVSGTPRAVTETIKQARKAGAHSTKHLNVSGAFHSALMEPACQKFAKALEKTPISSCDFSVYANVSAVPFVDADSIRALLLQQLTAPVQWSKIVQQMIDDGVNEIVEVGPGKVLQGLSKRISKNITVLGVCDLASVEVFHGR